MSIQIARDNEMKQLKKTILCLKFFYNVGPPIDTFHEEFIY